MTQANIDETVVAGVGFDLGCGSGRWAKVVAPRVGELHLIDASADALAVARRNLKDEANCRFHHAGVDEIPLAAESCDFGYSLGVLRHIPDTAAGLNGWVAKLKTGAPFLLYLYYRFDNRPFWFRVVWRASDILRLGVSKLPHSLRYWISQVFAAAIYFPLARTSLLLEKLSQYRNRSFYVMRTDALDGFGTRLEQRFTKHEMREMMHNAGLRDVRFSETSFWTAVGYRE